MPQYSVFAYLEHCIQRLGVPACDVPIAHHQFRVHGGDGHFVSGQPHPGLTAPSSHPIARRAASNRRHSRRRWVGATAGAEALCIVQMAWAQEQRQLYHFPNQAQRMQ